MAGINQLARVRTELCQNQINCQLLIKSSKVLVDDDDDDEDKVHFANARIAGPFPLSRSLLWINKDIVIIYVHI